MTKSDLDLYLRMIQKWTNRTKLDAQYKGGADMGERLEAWAIKAINKYHNEQ